MIISSHYKTLENSLILLPMHILLKTILYHWGILEIGIHNLLLKVFIIK